MIKEQHRIGLIVNSAPFSERSGRDQVDLAISALTMGHALELVFCGAGVLHLQTDKQSGAALLPPTWKAWASLDDLGEVHAWVLSNTEPGFRTSALLLDAKPADRAHVRARLASCDKVMVI